MLLGYTRVWTNEQDTAARASALEFADCEKISGEGVWRSMGPARATKAEFESLVSKVASEDVVKSSDLIDRMKPPRRYIKGTKTAAGAARLFYCGPLSRERKPLSQQSTFEQA
jgi:hypothetical protein